MTKLSEGKGGISSTELPQTQHRNDKTSNVLLTSLKGAHLHDVDKMIVASLARNLTYVLVFAALTAVVITLLVAWLD
ncbi:hypothetical protein ACVITL_002606 [Rhizobium pisi]